MSDFLTRLGSELDAAAARQARRRRLRWPASRPGRLLAVGGALVAFAGAGGAATGLIGLPGQVGGPPTLTYARLTPEQTAAGLEERTRPVVIGRGRLAEAGWSWQLIAFQTTRGLCVAVDVPQYDNVGGGCGSDRPRDGRPVDWQGYLTRLGRTSPAMVLGAVSPAATRVIVAGTEDRGASAAGGGARRVKRAARIVRVEDPRVLEAIGVERPFAYYVGETAGSNPWAVVSALAAGGRLLGRAVIPNGGAGSAGFVRRESCEVADPAVGPVERVTLPLPAAAREAFAVLRRPQRASDRPQRLLRRFDRQRLALLGRGQMDVGLMRRLPGTPERYLVVARARPLPATPADCLQSLPPRLRAIERRAQASQRRWAEAVWLSVVNRKGRQLGSLQAGDPWQPRTYTTGSLPGHRSVVSGIVPDGVAAVDVRYGRGGGKRATATVRGNFYLADLPAGHGALRRVRVTWRDADGRVVRPR